MRAGACAACHSCPCASSALPHACPRLMHIGGCHARPDQASKPCVPNPGAGGRAGHGGAAAAEGPAGGRGERTRAGLAAGAPGRVRRGLPRVAAHAGALTHGDAAAPLSVTPGLLCALARTPPSAVCEGSRLGGTRKAVCSADPACTQPRRAVSAGVCTALWVMRRDDAREGHERCCSNATGAAQASNPCVHSEKKLTSPLAKHKLSPGFPQQKLNVRFTQTPTATTQRLSFTGGAPLYSLAAHSSRAVQ